MSFCWPSHLSPSHSQSSQLLAGPNTGIHLLYRLSCCGLFIAQILEHNGLETHYSLWLRARHSHVMKFTRSRCIQWNTFWTNSLHVFSITEVQFAQLIFTEHIRRYECFITTESRPRIVFTKPGKPPQKCLVSRHTVASLTLRCTRKLTVVAS